MVAGKGTFIGDMLQKCGLTNAFDAERYPEITPDQLIQTKPDVIFLSSEPYPFREKHIAEFKIRCPNAIVKVVDGEMFFAVREQAVAGAWLTLAGDGVNENHSISV